MKTLLLFLLFSCAAVDAANYDDWIASYGLSGDDADKDADPDLDRIPNLLEYAFDGLNPTEIDQAPASMPVQGWLRRTGTNRGDWEWVSISSRTSGSGGVWHSGLRWSVRPEIENIRFVPELSDLSSLKRWYSGRSAWIIRALPGNTLEAGAIVQGNKQQRFFMRVRVVWDGTVGNAFDGIPVSGLPLSGLDVEETTTVARAIGGGGTSTVTDQDLSILRTTGATSVTDIRWHYQATGENPNGAVVSRSVSPSGVVVPNATDPFLWDFVAAGSATLRMTTGSSKYEAAITTTSTPTTTVDEIQGAVAGSLREHLNAEIDGRIAGKTASAALPIFSTQNHGTATYVRNTGGWAADVDLTAISPWNSDAGTNKAGVAISPRHVLFATHYYPMVGCTLRFIAADNTVVTRTLTAVEPLTLVSGYYPDLTVGKLDSDLPSSISFVKILPDDWEDYLPTLDRLEVPVCGTDQEEKLLVMEMPQMSTSIAMRLPTGAARRAFNEAIVGGDSGNPAMMIINDELVLLTCWTYGGAGKGTSVNWQHTAIDAAMTSLGGGYTLTDVDLSAYATY